MVFPKLSAGPRRRRLIAVSILLALALLVGALLSLVPCAPPHTVPILMYHSINDHPVGIEYLSMSSTDFEQQIKYLAESGYTALTLDEDYHTVEKPVYITFDDGYADNYTSAYPILKKYHMRATIFLVARYLDKPGYLTGEQIRSMEDIISFQSHTVDHLRLDRLSRGDIEYECRQSQAIISAVTGKPVFALSYPNGAMNADITAIAAKYYSCALTTMDGFDSKITGNYRIRRVTVSSAMALDGFIEKMQSNGKI